MFFIILYLFESLPSNIFSIFYILHTIIIADMLRIKKKKVLKCVSPLSNKMRWHKKDTSFEKYVVRLEVSVDDVLL